MRNIVVVDSWKGFINICNRVNFSLMSTVYINTKKKPTWNNLRGISNIGWSNIYCDNFSAVPPELKGRLALVAGEDNLIEEYFCPFNKSHIQKECFERDCPYLNYEKGRSFCSFFEEQIKKRKDVKKFTKQIFEGDDTRGITMDLIDDALKRKLAPVRIVIDKYRFSLNMGKFQYRYCASPTIIESISEYDLHSKAQLVEMKEIPVVVRDSVHDAITVEAV